MESKSEAQNNVTTDIMTGNNFFLLMNEIIEKMQEINQFNNNASNEDRLSFKHFLKQFKKLKKQACHQYSKAEKDENFAVMLYYQRFVMKLKQLIDLANSSSRNEQILEAVNEVILSATPPESLVPTTKVIPALKKAAIACLKGIIIGAIIGIAIGLLIHFPVLLACIVYGESFSALLYTVAQPALIGSVSSGFATGMVTFVRSIFSENRPDYGLKTVSQKTKEIINPKLISDFFSHPNLNVELKIDHTSRISPISSTI